MESNEDEPNRVEHIASVSDSDQIRAEDAMSPDTDRDPFEEIASEFSERHRRGELPSVEEYAQKYPELAEEIRDLFPTIAAMEQLKERKAPAKPTLGGLPLEQLGDFRILGEIGRGGMGVVYEAEQVSLGRHVAVKVLPKQALLDERHLRRFEREAQTAAKLHHTNIVPVFGVGQQDGYHYIVMQFIPGVGLDEILIALRTMVLQDDSSQYGMDSSSRASHASHNAKALLDGNFSKHASSGLASFVKNTKVDSGTQSLGGTAATMELPSAVAASSFSISGPPPSETPESKPLDADNSRVLASMDREYYQSVAKIGQQVADALAYAHEQGTLHRDIKPGNLLLDGTGTVWVADFGLAKLAEQENVSRTGDIVGTLSYMPPESFSGDVDSRGDIYALGLTLYEMLAMRPAYYGRDRAKLVKRITDGDRPRLSKLNPSIPRDLETIVLKAIEQRPEDRYATARNLEEDLEAFLTDMPIKARRMSVPEQFTRWCRKNKLVASLSAAVVSLLVLSSITFGVLNWQANKAKEDAVAAAELANQETARAEAEAKNAEDAKKEAREIAIIAIGELKNRFNDIFSERLPLSADQSLQTPLDEDLIEVSQLAEDDSEENTADSQTATQPSGATVSAAPVTAETAVLAEAYLQSFQTLAKSMSNGKSDFAPTFAEMTVSVGKLYKLLGNREQAEQYFGEGIEIYESLVADSPTPSAVVGLANSYNELGDLIAMDRSTFQALSTYKKSLDLLTDEQNQTLLADSSRAKYEHARTLFLMSMLRGGPKGHGFNRGGGRRGGGPRGGGRRRGRGGENGFRGEGPPPKPGDGGRGDDPGPPPPSGDRGGDRPRSEVAELMRIAWNPQRNLKQAIEILKPLVESEANTAEYRYLMARCYTGLSIHGMRSLGPKQQPRLDNEKAQALMEQLVKDEPSVADYKFELAISKFFSLEIQDLSIEERVRIAREILVHTSEISKKNPGISNYAIVDARAKLFLAEVLDEQADRLERAGNGDMLTRRVDAQKAMTAAVTNLLDVRDRFADAMNGMRDRFPSKDEMVFLNLKINAKKNLEQARELKRNGKQAAADELLQETKAMLENVGTFSYAPRSQPGRRQRVNPIYEQALLLCLVELEASGRDAAIQAADRIKKNLLKESKASSRGNRKHVVWELDFLQARVLQTIGAEPEATAMFGTLRAELEGFWSSLDPSKLDNQTFNEHRDVIQQVMNSTQLYEAILVAQGNEKAAIDYREQRRRLIDRFLNALGRGGGRGGFGRPRSNRQGERPPR